VGVVGVLATFMEWLGGAWAEHPLDPLVSWWVWCLVAVGVGLLLASVYWGLSRLVGRHSASLLLLAVGSVWCPIIASAWDTGTAWGVVGILVLTGIMWGRSVLSLAMIVALAFVMGAARPAPDWDPERTEEASLNMTPSVLLVTIDTVRSDANLFDDALFPVSQGWHHFTQAVAGACWTPPSMHTLFTGMPVSEHGGGVSGEDRIPSLRLDTAKSWVETLRERGYLTTAVVSNPHLRKKTGFAAGFDHWVHSDDAREPSWALHTLFQNRYRLNRNMAPRLMTTRDERVVRLAEETLRRLPKTGAFVWVHLFSPHEYKRAVEEAVPGWVAGRTELSVMRQAYAVNVQATAARLGSLTDAAKDWMVVMTSDHGESFGESEAWGHGTALHDPELRVPLVVRGTGVKPGKTTFQVGLQDVGRFILRQLDPPSGTEENGHFWGVEHGVEVEVGGVRRYPLRAAVRMLDGTYRSVERDSVIRGEANALSERTVAELQALGYMQ